RILQVGFQETRGAPSWSHVRCFRNDSRLLQPHFFFAKKVLPLAENVFRGHAETAFDEKAKRCLPRWSKIEQRSSPEPIKVPQKFLQSIRNAHRARAGRFGSSRGPQSRNGGHATRSCILRNRPGNLTAGSRCRANTEFIQKAHESIRRELGVERNRARRVAPSWGRA